jgi:hypothetical protein
MRKHISFTIAAAIMGLAFVFWAAASVLNTNAEVARLRVDLSSPESLTPVY